VTAKLAVVEAGLAYFGNDTLRQADGSAPAAVIARIELFVHFSGIPRSII
jgi:hypothetical protein